MGIMPRKKGATERLNSVFLEFYERTKASNREKNPRLALITVEEMAAIAGITRQTMYEYLERWLTITLIVKTSYIDERNKAVIGYKLNGATLDQAFEKVKARITENLTLTSAYIQQLQKIIKNEKLSKQGTQKSKKQDPEEKDTETTEKNDKNNE